MFAIFNLIAGHPLLTMSLLEFKEVTKSYRKHFWTSRFTAVDELSFRVEEKRIVGFVGPNGAGKTTSIKMLLGLVKPTSGTILLNGRPVSDPKSRVGIAYLSEQPYFYEHLSVWESLEFGYKLMKLPSAARKKEIDRVLETVELTEVAGKRVLELSKGMQQRLSMAQALLGDAHAFIFDEPMSGLDPLGRALFRTIFRSLTERGKSIFFSTHILADIESLCDEIVVLSKGKLVYQGEVDRVLAQGFLGTDIRVSSLDQSLRGQLSDVGCDVSDSSPEESTIFVPKTGDPEWVQKLLFEKGVFCKSITRRNTSLENLLYASSGQESADRNGKKDRS